MLTLIAAGLLAAFGAKWDPALDVHPEASARMPSEDVPRFRAAKPVWPAGQEKKINAFVGFRSDFTFSEGDPVLRITASSQYRVWVNGRFAGYGPVRAAHGFFRVDEWPLARLATSGRNAIAVEVVHYGETVMTCPGRQDAFLCCEVTSGDAVLCATGRDFAYFDLPRVPNTSRITPQRGRIEMYRLDQRWADWRDKASAGRPDRRFAQSAVRR